MFLDFCIKGKVGLMCKNRPAGDEEVEGLWREIGHQYKVYKWSNVKTFKFDLTGYISISFSEDTCQYCKILYNSSFTCRNPF